MSAKRSLLTSTSLPGRNAMNGANRTQKNAPFSFTVVSRPQSSDNAAVCPNGLKSVSVITTDTPEIFDGDMIHISRSAPSEVKQSDHYTFLAAMTPAPILQKLAKRLYSINVSFFKPSFWIIQFISAKGCRLAITFLRFGTRPTRLVDLGFTVPIPSTRDSSEQNWRLFLKVARISSLS